MSENKHTPEPWRTDEECGFPQDIHDSKGNLFLRCGSDFDNEIYGEANARRVVACVNACAGISTENLEDNKPLIELAMAYNVALRQRDELLAATEAIAINSEECLDFDECTAMLVSIDDYHKLMEAVARAKGEQ